MKTLIAVLIIASFLQTTILPLDLVLLILICRSYIKSERINLYLAFGFGLLISHLELKTLGPISITYLVLIFLTQILSKSRLAGNSLLIVPVSLILLFLNQIISSQFTLQAFQFSFKIFIESLLALPVLYLIRFWEERFIVRKEIKLRV